VDPHEQFVRLRCGLGDVHDLQDLRRPVAGRDRRLHPHQRARRPTTAPGPWSRCRGRRWPRRTPWGRLSADLTREELADAIEAGDVVVLEALLRSYWGTEHFPGAHALPLDEIDSLAHQPISDRDGPVVVYCSNTECIAAGLPVESAVFT
jgi:hypothetical protein